MRQALVSCALLLGVAAGTVQADAPLTGLDRLAALLPGTWRTAGQTFDSQFTKAGPQSYTIVRDCWREDSALKCVNVVNGVLQLYDIFSWDEGGALYEETQITPQGKQPGFHITVKGETWTYDQEITDRNGGVIHYRIVRTYASALSADYLYEYSSDGKTWTPIARGTETKFINGK